MLNAFKRNGAINPAIIYKGPSELDGAPIVAIATVQSHNVKTGAMLQIWILADNGRDPLENNRLGNDFSICGNCPLKGIPAPHKAKGTAEKRPCYVTLYHAPLNVWKTYMRGNYAVCGFDQLARYGEGQNIRLGAYGDPAAIPPAVVSELLSMAKNWTGYSHQFDLMDKARRRYWGSAVMVSADTLADAVKHWAENRRTFRMVSDVSDVMPNEVICPATPEGGKRTTCANCNLCKGSDIGAKSVAVVAHGGGAKYANAIIAKGVA